MGLSDKDMELLVAEVSVIINCAGTTDFNTRLDLATRTNVTGPLRLLQLAEKCGDKFQCFCQVSTCYAVSDKQGFIEERLIESAVNWQATYD
jgi:thioester reductase-like protein